MSRIVVTDVRKSNSPSIKAFADVKIGQSEFYDFRVIQGKEDGEVRHKKIIKLNSELMAAAVQDAVLEAYKEPEQDFPF